jgi:hypothetical protein
VAVITIAAEIAVMSLVSLHQVRAVDGRIGLLGWGQPATDLAGPRKGRARLPRRTIGGRL